MESGVVAAVSGVSVPSSPATGSSRRGWALVAGAFGALLCMFGVAYSYGVFFRAVAVTFHVSAGSTSLLFSLTSLVFFALGAVTGPLAARIGPRPLIALGAVLFEAGLVGTALSHQLFEAYLASALGLGMGIGCTYVPLVAAVSGWFTTRRALAVGIVVSGIGVGTLVVAPLSSHLITAVGWRSTDLVLAAGSAGPLVGCVLAVSRPPAQHLEGGLLPGERRFGLQLFFSTLLISVVIFTPLVSLPDYAAQRHLAPGSGADLVGLIGIASVGGRLVSGAAGHRLGLRRTYGLAVLLVGLSVGAWLLSGAVAWLVVFAIVLGLGYGGCITNLPTVLAELHGPALVGRELGRQYVAVAIGAAVGPEVLVLLTESTRSYVPVQVSLLICGLVAAGLLVPLATKTKTTDRTTTERNAAFR